MSKSNISIINNWLIKNSIIPYNNSPDELFIIFYSDNEPQYKIYLSVQTSPDLIGQNFALTAIFKNENDNVIYPTQLGYHHNTFLSHSTPQILFKHIQYVKYQLGFKHIIQSILQL